MYLGFFFGGGEWGGEGNCALSATHLNSPLSLLLILLGRNTNSVSKPLCDLKLLLPTLSSTFSVDLGVKNQISIYHSVLLLTLIKSMVLGIQQMLIKQFTAHYFSIGKPHNEIKSRSIIVDELIVELSDHCGRGCSITLTYSLACYLLLVSLYYSIHYIYI